MSCAPWIIGGGVVAAYLWNHATKPVIKLPPLTSSGAGAVETAAPRNARRKDHPDLVSVVAHSRSWPGAAIRPR